MFAVGYLVAPLLFSQLADRSLAGSVAGTMFSAMAWVGLACGSYLLLFVLAGKGWRAISVAACSGSSWLMLGLALATGHFGIQPIHCPAQGRRTAAAGDGKRIARPLQRPGMACRASLYLIQSLFGLWLVVWQERGKH
jgi:hypothetical protein